jgi:hypothetical protein
MATWTSQDKTIEPASFSYGGKSGQPQSPFQLLIEDGFYLLIDDTYFLNIQNQYAGFSWSNTSKSSATWANKAKN